MSDHLIENEAPPAVVSVEGGIGEDAYATWFGEFSGRRVLLAEDTAVHAEQVRNALITAGCERVDIFQDGEAALAAAETHSYDVLLLDIHMPGLLGLDLLRRVRAGNGLNHDAIAFFLTVSNDARTRRDAVSKSADIRAEDFLVKPVKDEELIARLGEQLEQRNLKTNVDIYCNGPLELSTKPLQASILGEPLKLSAKRLALLSLLMRNCPRPVTRQMIAIACWKEQWAGNGYVIDRCRDDSISSLIWQLRSVLKAGAPNQVQHLFEDILIAVPNEGLRMMEIGDQWASESDDGEDE